MNKTQPVMARVAPEVKDKLRAIARSTKRSESFLAREAIEAFVEANAWQIEIIKEGLDAVKAGEPGIPHDEVITLVEAGRTKRARTTHRRRP